MIRSKKGVSPLIATVLIIALTVALTVFLMNWTFGFFKERTGETSKATREQLLCATINFDFDCSCPTTGPDATSCSLSFTNNALYSFSEVIRARLISANGKIASSLPTDPNFITEIPALQVLSTTLAKPSGGIYPYDFEIIVPKIRDPTTLTVVQCGALARLRKTCR